MAWSEQALTELGGVLGGLGETAADLQVLIQWGPWIKDDHKSWMPAHRCIRIDAETMSLVAAHWHASKTEEATTLLLQAFLNRYPLPDAEPQGIGVYAVRLHPVLT